MYGQTTAGASRLPHACEGYAGTGPGHERARRIIDTAPDGFVGMDVHGIVTDWNAAAERLFGFSRDEAVGSRLGELIIPEAARAAHEAGLRRFARTGVGSLVGRPLQVTARRRDGREFPVDLTIWPQQEPGGLSFYAFIRDVSDRVAAEEAAQLAAIVTASPDAIFSADIEGNVRAWNPGAERVYGYSAAEMTGTPLSRLVPPERREEFEGVWRQVSAGRPVELETVRTRADGSRVHVSLSVSPVRDLNGEVVRLAFVARDITAAKAAERHLRETKDALARQAEEMEHRAFHDPLTGLANRALLTDRLGHALAQASHTRARVTLLMIDVDDFKNVNDSLGHGAGDHLLCQLADRLRATVRAGDTVARLGGDEFAVLIEQATDEEGAHVAERIGHALTAPIDINGLPATTTVSVGVADSAPGDALAADDMLRHADLAMYAAKNAGKSGWRSYQTDLHDELASRVRLESELRNALAADQYVVHYQPICDPYTGQTRAAEALLRWQHPDRGLVSPTEFVPVLEQTGLIVQVGAWVLRQACAQAARLRETGVEIAVSVNVCLRQLADPGFIDVVEEALATAELPPHALTLEITETLLVGSIEDTVHRLDELRRLGVHLAVDDFGTGHSSLGRLRSLPVTSLKIDRSFIHESTANETDDTIIKAVVAMAHGLGLPVVAEGVETIGQLSRLRKLGCDAVQGYLFARPMPPAELHRYVTDPTWAYRGTARESFSAA